MFDLSPETLYLGGSFIITLIAVVALLHQPRVMLTSRDLADIRAHIRYEVKELLTEEKRRQLLIELDNKIRTDETIRDLARAAATKKK